MIKENNLRIAVDEKLYLDEVELKNVQWYKLHHCAGKEAELIIKLEVTINQDISGQQK